MIGHNESPRFRIETELTPGRVAAVWVVADEVEFPEAGWTDFPLIVLRWWADTTAELIRNGHGRIEWLFMDGPYSVEIHATGPDNVRFRRQLRSGFQTQHSATVPITQIASELEHTLDRMIADAGSRAAAANAEITDLVAARDGLAAALRQARIRTGESSG